MSKTKILALSDSISGITGFGSVTRDILTRLDPKKYEIRAVGYNLPAGMQPIKECTFEDGFKIKNITQYPGGLNPGGQQLFGLDRVGPMIKSWKPDIFWCLLDTFMLFQAGYQNLDMTPAKFCMYYPSDGGYFPQNCDTILRKAQHSIAMSKFAQKQVKDIYGINSHYIPHGINSKYYHPIKDKVKCKTMTPHGHPTFKNKFIVGSVFRNQPRKQSDLLIKSFAKFAEKKNDVVLLLHTDPDDPARTNDLRFMAARYNLHNKVFFTGMKIFDGFTLEQMKYLYNSFDVHALTTTGEGFGVPTIEAMACGVPSVITNCTTTKELVLDHGAGLGANVSSEVTGSWHVERALVDTDDFAAKLQYLYDNPKLRKEMGARGIEAVKKYYDYDKVVSPEWERYFQQEVLQ